MRALTLSSLVPMRGLALPSLRRSSHMLQRNSIVYKHLWLILVSGFFEPLFYLLGIGFGVGAMVGDVGAVSYGAFVAPGLLAAHCMNGAITDGFFNIFFKLHYEKTYDGILATPMSVPDIAFGEMLWALSRGSMYAAAFIAVILSIGELMGPRMLISLWALLALPAAVLVSASFSAMALCLTSFVRKIPDFDIVMGLLVTPMFLFAGIFFPVDQLPQLVQWVVQAVPLYHAVALLRQLTTGTVDLTIFIHVVYLISTGFLALVVAMHRLERALIK
jgi:lipooligosaccharide transport system permease protein